MESVVKLSFESDVPPVFTFETVYGLDEILCEKKSAAASERIMLAVCAIFAVLSAVLGYYLITIISGFAVLLSLISLLGIKSSAEKVFAEKGEESRLYSFYIDGFSVRTPNSAAYFPYERLLGFREAYGHFIIKTENGTELVIPKGEEADSGFIRFLNEKMKRKDV